MKIRQYTAASMQEAILKIKVDLGPHAVILHTRKFKQGGFMGFFAQDRVEVLAAIDPNESKEKTIPAAEPAVAAVAAEALARSKAARQASDEADSWDRGRRGAEPRGRGREDYQADEIELGPHATSKARAAVAQPEPAVARAERGTTPEERRARLAEQARANGVVLLEDDEPAPKAASGAPAQVTMMHEGGTQLADEVQDLKSTVSDLKDMLVSMAGKLEIGPRSVAQFPTLLQRIYDKLIASDVDASIARGLVVYLQKEQPHLTTHEALCDALEQPISGLFRVAPPLTIEAGERKIVALVGPTGVGKTTTIAKLAANFALQRHVDMALLTIDTYRVAAIEQLKTYGDIIGLPVETVLTPQSLKEAVKLHSGKGMILIDTAGRSPYNRMHINELRSFLDVESQTETHLVLSATTKLADLKNIVKHFASVGVDRLIFTKTDETGVVGGAISVAHETGLPVSYITTGQSVPDDILVAESATLARMLINEIKG